MIIAMSGHRPEKIPDVEKTQLNIYIGMRVAQTTHVIQGMASGVDLWSAKCAHKIDIPYTCARPWAGHTPRVADRHDYEMALKYAASVYNVSPSENYTGPWLYQKRNEWMVDNADIVFAIWDGTPGGTANCVNYAKKQEKKILRYDPAKDEMFWEYGV